MKYIWRFTTALVYWFLLLPVIVIIILVVVYPLFVIWEFSFKPANEFINDFFHDDEKWYWLVYKDGYRYTNTHNTVYTNPYNCIIGKKDLLGNLLNKNKK